MNTSQSQEVEELLGRTSNLFLRYGVKSNTMDDIARHLGISKKTLYQFVSNKEDLLEKCFHHKFTEISTELARISKHAPDAISELFEMDRFIVANRKQRNPVVLHELQKFYPRLFETIHRLNRKHVQKFIFRNVERGQAEGLFRKDAKADIISTLYVNRLESLVNEEVFPLTKFSFEEVIFEHLAYHIRGLVTLAGLVKFESIKPTS